MPISVHDIHICSSGQIPVIIAEINSGFVSGLYSGVGFVSYLEDHLLREFNKKASGFGLMSYMTTGQDAGMRATNYFYTGNGGGSPETFNIVQIGGDRIVLIGGDNLVLV